MEKGIRFARLANSKEKAITAAQVFIDKYKLNNLMNADKLALLFAKIPAEHQEEETK